MAIGAFSTDKSSFINVLFGEEIAMVGALLTTAAITKLSYVMKKLQYPSFTLLFHLKCFHRSVN